MQTKENFKIRWRYLEQKLEFIKLNPKRAKIHTKKGVWAVPYAMLSTVIDGELADGELADGELITAKPAQP